MTCGFPTTPERIVVDGVALDTDPSTVASGVTFCFTERTGGVSTGPFSSLNLGFKGGDDPDRVRENRRRVLVAMGAGDLLAGLVVPNQVHGDTVAVVRDGEDELPACIDEGADAVVCTAHDRAVMLLFADCAPVVLVAPRGFAVVHSGWRGTLAGIAGKAAGVLAREAGCGAGELAAYIGPHISREAYEVSMELAETFEGRFGPTARCGERHLDLGACIAASLGEAGLEASRIVDSGLCTASLTGRFFSHRAEHGNTGRHAAVAFMRAEGVAVGDRLRKDGR